MLKQILIRKVMEPSKERALDYAKTHVDRIIKEKELMTVRLLKKIDLALSEISKELSKDVESPLSSDTEMSILMKNVDIRIKSEKMECSSTYDVPLDAKDRELLQQRIEKVLDAASAKLSVRSFDSITMSLMRILELD